MTLERDGIKGPFILDCDAHGCRETFETHCFIFLAARDAWRAEGWMAHYNSQEEEWRHLCPKHEQELQAGSLDESEID